MGRNYYVFKRKYRGQIRWARTHVRCFTNTKSTYKPQSWVKSMSTFRMFPIPTVPFHITTQHNATLLAPCTIGVFLRWPF